MSLGFLLILLGWAASLSHAFRVLDRTFFQIRPEERALDSLFGAAFAACNASVRRWI